MRCERTRKIFEEKYLFHESFKVLRRKIIVGQNSVQDLNFKKEISLKYLKTIAVKLSSRRHLYYYLCTTKVETL